MCSLFDSLARRAEVMLPGETVTLTQDAILALLNGCAPCRASKRALRTITKAAALPLTEPPLAKGMYSVAAIAERVGASASALRTLIAKETFGPRSLFLGGGPRKYMIPGAIAERILAHVHFGEPLRTFRLTEQDTARVWAQAPAASTADVGTTPVVATPSAQLLGRHPAVARRDSVPTARRSPARGAEGRSQRTTTAPTARDLSKPMPLDSWRQIANPRSTPR